METLVTESGIPPLIIRVFEEQWAAVLRRPSCNWQVLTSNPEILLYSQAISLACDNAADRIRKFFQKCVLPYNVRFPTKEIRVSEYATILEAQQLIVSHWKEFVMSNPSIHILVDGHLIAHYLRADIAIHNQEYRWPSENDRSSICYVLMCRFEELCGGPLSDPHLERCIMQLAVGILSCPMPQGINRNMEAIVEYWLERLFSVSDRCFIFHNFRDSVVTEAYMRSNWAEDIVDSFLSHQRKSHAKKFRFVFHENGFTTVEKIYSFQDFQSSAYLYVTY